jgi:hypothetical protein
LDATRYALCNSWSRNLAIRQSRNESYFWHKIRGKDPREHFSKVGHTATEALKGEHEGNREFWALKDVSPDRLSA